MKIRVFPPNTTSTYAGVPPYYMMAYAEGGTTIVSHIGHDPDQLSWQVQNPKGMPRPAPPSRFQFIHDTNTEGSKLVLTVVDSANSTGGFNTNFYDVVGASNCGNYSGQPLIICCAYI